MPWTIAHYSARDGRVDVLKGHILSNPDDINAIDEVIITIDY